MAGSIEAYFDSVAEDYDSHKRAGWYQAHGELVLGLAGELPAGARVLDIGCGTGHLLRRMATDQPAIEALGVDLSARMVAVARATGAAHPGLRFEQMDWESPGAPARVEGTGFDLVTCLNCAHYFADPVGAFRRMRHALRPGGRLLLLDRARDGAPATALLGLLHRHLLRDRVRFHAAGDLARMVREAGFAEVRIAARVRRWAWKGKLVTSLAVIQAQASPHTFREDHS
ncbi:class I SAM-dependent methyltransferase [Falsiroseomonas sp. HC035]|uniref:class I SAM-dependent methyltransferase n=1 Tax=Falsiroseomonas sp. HC035 TaxID=3390999 RepID=UPI003D31F5AE